MTTAELTTRIRAVFAVDSEPLPVMPIVDSLIRPCSCGAAAVAMVYQWQPDGLSTYVARCRDHKAVPA